MLHLVNLTRERLCSIILKQAYGTLRRKFGTQFSASTFRAPKYQAFLISNLQTFISLMRQDTNTVSQQIFKSFHANPRSPLSACSSLTFWFAYVTQKQLSLFHTWRASFNSDVRKTIIKSWIISADFAWIELWIFGDLLQLKATFFI